MKIVEDRVLARVAFEAVGWNAAVATGDIADVALGHALIALRVQGVAAGPEILRTLRADIETVLADPAQMARAASFANPGNPIRPANTNRASARRAAVG